MAGLSDMEELISKISNKDIVDYMREALSCYNGGAYRGCIVMSYIALFDDIRAKLAELAKVNNVAKTISKEIEKRANNQDVFETYMADQIRVTGLITTAEAERLEMIRVLRNKAAHPSGIHASPEEARFVFHTVIMEFLSKQLLKTTHAVDAIVERLDKANLFPSTNVDEVKALAADEISGLHQTAFPYLVTKLVEAAESSDDQISKNADRFLVGLAAQHRPELRAIIQSKLIIAKSHHEDYRSVIGRLVSADGALLAGLGPEVRMRVSALLVKEAELSKSAASSSYGHPARQLSGMIKALGEEVALKEYPTVIAQTIERFPYAPNLLATLKDAPQIAERLLAIWHDNAKSSDFATANSFASAMEDIDNVVEDVLSDADAFELVVSVNRAADWGARRSKSVRSSHFESAPNLVAAAQRYIEKNKSAATKTVDKRLGITLEEFEEQSFGLSEE